VKCILINPHAPPGTHVMRSYSGGFGDLFDLEKASQNLILFPPIELMRYATAARNLGYTPCIFDLQADPRSLDSLSAELDNCSPELIIVSTSLPTYTHDLDLVRNLLLSAPEAKVVFVTTVRDKEVASLLLEIPQVIAVATPDGAVTLSDIINEAPSHNAIIRQKNGPIQLLPIAYADPVDKIPEPAFDLIDFSRYTFPLFRNPPINFVATIHSSYGCPYPCGFYCPYPLAEGNRVRRHSLGRVISEIKTALACGAKSIVFRDPLFSANSKFVESLCTELLQQHLTVKWWCESRIDRLSPELLEHMHKAGCVGMEVGVESGDESVMGSVGKVGLTLEMVKEFHSTASALGLHVVYLFIFGLPSERKESLLKTVKLIRELNLSSDEFNVSIITPYPGTQLHQLAQEKGWIQKRSDSFTGYSVSMRTDILTTKDLEGASEFAKRLVEIRSSGATDRGQLREKLTNNLIAEMQKWAEGAK
jgi:radical SAM superfamily enzyme YgiQ (UPF0313 family)